MSQPIIYWFRHDLRLTDLPALHAGAATGSVIPVFILDDDTPGDWRLGGASRWWLHHSLTALGRRIAEQGGELLFFRGQPEAILPSLCKSTQAQGVYCSRQYQPWSETEERRVHETLSAQGVFLKRYPGHVLFEPGTVLTGAGTPYKVFTPFWRAARALPPPATPLPETTPNWAPAGAHRGQTLDELALCPTQPNWAAGWEDLWTPGEIGAQQTLDTFLANGVARYDGGRDIPSEINTSRLSPHLKFGEISPRQVWHRAQHTAAQRPQIAGQVDKFLSEIGWREFCYQLLGLFPDMPEQAFKSPFAQFPWAASAELIAAWEQGRTGYPIVDAGMRELWQTGFMHNRVRMITASFLTKHLLAPWQVGERWFWDCLLDADLAANACSWQWVAGSGADAAPYFRIFNPVAQGEKFDPKGLYVKRWCPELGELPPKYVHKPWEAPPLTLAQADVKLGDNYPYPVVDHASARQQALAAYDTIKGL
jgi:deoxyribodipyrimidine photo-lyase